MAHHQISRAHRDRCARSTGHRSARLSFPAPAGRADRPDVAHTAFAECLFETVSEVIPAPSLGLATDEAAWAAFEDLLDDAACFIVDTLGVDGGESVRALASRLSADGPVQGALIARALDRLEPGGPR